MGFIKLESGTIIHGSQLPDLGGEIKLWCYECMCCPCECKPEPTCIDGNALDETQR